MTRTKGSKNKIGKLEGTGRLRIGITISPETNELIKRIKTKNPELNLSRYIEQLIIRDYRSTASIASFFEENTE